MAQIKEVILFIYRFKNDKKYRYTVFETSDELERFTNNFGDSIIRVKTETVRFHED